MKAMQNLFQGNLNRLIINHYIRYKYRFIVGKIPIQLKEQYSEVEDYLRFGSIDCNSVTIGDKNTTQS